MHDIIKYSGIHAYRIELYTKDEQPDEETFAQTSITKLKILMFYPSTLFTFMFYEKIFPNSNIC